MNSLKKLNQFVITSSSNHSISAFVAQNFLHNTRLLDRPSIFDGFLALCEKIPDSQKDSFISTMTQLCESGINEQNEDSLTDFGTLTHFSETCLHPRRSRQEPSAPQNGWSHLLSMLVTLKRYSFAPVLLDEIKRGLDKEKSLLTIPQISSVDFWDYLNEAVFFFSEKDNIAQVQHLIRFFVNIQPSLPSEHIPYFLGKINLLWMRFVTLMETLDQTQFYIFYSFFRHVFLEIPQKYIPSLIEKISTDYCKQGDMFINVLARSQERNNFNSFKSILSFLSRIERRAHTAHCSVLMNGKILQTTESSLFKQLMDLLLNNLKQEQPQYTNALFDFFLSFLEQSPIAVFGQFWMGKEDNVLRLQFRMQAETTNKNEFENNAFVCKMIKKSHLTYPQETEEKIASFLSVLIKKIGDLSAHVWENKQAMYLSFSVMSYIRAIDQSSYFSRLFHSQQFVVSQAFQPHKATLERCYQDVIGQFLKVHPRTITQEMKKELRESRFHQYQWKQYHVSAADKKAFDRMYASIGGDEQKSASCCLPMQ